tara:strand:+ start:165 stop:650 length:486 start_codon:yes stop_codon:yes gene_type:complete
MDYEECPLCFKRFYDKGQKLKPKYALSHHEQTCYQKLFKKQKKFIKEWLDYTATKSEINTFYNNIKDHINSEEDKLTIQKPVLRRCTPSPLSSNISMEINDRESCSSAISSASSGEWNSWKYQGQWYSYDKDNNVYDESGNHLGERIQDEFNDEWKILYDE